MRLGPLALLLFVSLATTQARAQEPEAASEAASDAASEAASEATPDPEPTSPRPAHRPLPDYDGRVDPPPGALASLLVIPRTLFGPVHFVAEVLIRQPLRFIASRVSESERSERALDFFRFGPEGRLLMLPTFRIDPGQRTSIGAYFFAEDAGAEDNEIRLLLHFGWLDYVTGDILDRWVHERFTLEARAGFDLRGDALFWGLGKNAGRDKRSAYSWTGNNASLGGGYQFWRRSHLDLDAGFRWFETDDRDDDRGPSVSDGATQGLFSLPAGFGEEVSVGHLGARLVLDTRRTPPAAETGVVLTLAASFHADIVEGALARSWFDWSTALDASVDLSGNRNLLGFHLLARFADALRGEIPFLLLPELSGDGPMPGFRPGRLVGPSLLAARISYRWPIAATLEGRVELGIGGAFAEHLSDIRPRDLRLEFNAGLGATQRRDHYFQFLVGLGTERFGDGSRVESIRIIFGGSRGL